MNFSNIENFPFLYELNTRWKDMDTFGHVNNAVFLTYIEDARISFFRRWKLNNREKSIIMASIKIDYLRQVNHPSNLVVGQRISRLGKTSFDIHSVVFIQDDPHPAAAAVVSAVCFDYETNKSVPLYPEIKADFQQNNTG